MLSRTEIKTLSEFLAGKERPDGTLRFHELQGFLFAVACSPELIPPSGWFPIISGEKDIGFKDEEQAQRIMGLIMSLYNSINDAAFERSRKMPTGCRFRPDIEANFDDERPISLWSCGFTIGHDWLSDVWAEYVQDDIDGELASTAMVLSFFASRDLAEAYYFDATTSPRKRKPRVPFVEFAQTVRKVFPDALSSYAQIGRGIAEILIELEASGR